MTLSELLKGVTVTKMFQTMYGKMVVTHDVMISGIQYDSRKVQRENLFVALRGVGTDGHKFISSAIANGAKAIVVEDDTSVPDAQCMHAGVVKIVVSNTRKALAQLSANYYGHPSKKMTMIAVTGTNGKTTTTYLIKQMLESFQQHKVGLVGTVENAIGQEKIPATHTTPESLELHQLFARMVEQHCTHCVMEVSSHALHQYRVHGIDFSTAVFTNLTQDHLDYHGTMDAYFQSKKILFDGLSESAVAVINADSEYGNTIVNGTKAKVITYSINAAADVKAENVTLSINGFTAEVHHRPTIEKISTKLVGRFNVYNFLGAYTATFGMPLSTADKQKSFGNLAPAPGRFEQVHAPQGWTAIIDYAHTPDALENCLQAIHDIMPANRANTILTIFGAGGDRDKTKRPKMGAIAERLSDAVIVTSDNPRTEDPQKIIEDILAGMKDKKKIIVQVDRARAIQEGKMMAKPGDIILVAGKGHEDYQVIGTTKHHFNDKEEIAKAV
ncbi:MAG: UDP-N-acetylmuramoyl-L-alanyl-D-glutamate--2,6-diaminopimelate ligase [Bacteroidota bacterium]|nr:UDP-N-acetylmuramoyl-L-alanyl-D-glutamate--2,6-diaminopimelate ligase [Bacteroidota bacterium]